MMRVYISDSKTNQESIKSEGLLKLQTILEDNQDSIPEEVLYSLEEAYQLLDKDLISSEEKVEDAEEKVDYHKTEMDEAREILKEYKRYKDVDKLKGLIKQALF